MRRTRADRPGERAAAAALLGSVGVFVVGYLIAVTAPGLSFSWRTNMVSELGAAGCRMSDGDWICSPRNAWFSAALVTCGLLVATGCALMRRRWGGVLSACSAVLGVSLVILGVFPNDVRPAAHMVGAVLALPVSSAGILFSAVRPATPWLHRQRSLRGVLGFVGLALCLAHVVPTPLMPRGLAETISVAAILGFLASEGVRCLSSPRTTSDRSRSTLSIGT